MTAADPAQRPGPPADILVVDDHAENRQLLAQLVTLLGHQGEQAGNGREALALLHARPFDLLLLDVLMPEVDGFAVLRQVKADERLREIPVIMVSGLGEVDSVVRCIEAGAEDYLTKPFDPVILRARINACLEKKRLRDAERRRAEELERALTQLKAAQDQLVTQAKLASLGALTAGIAHEIRNPLNFITNFARLAGDLVGELRAALSRLPGGEVAEILAGLERNVAKIEEHGQRADQIVRNMLMHARGQGGERQLTDLNALVEEFAQLGYHALRGQDPTFYVSLEMDLDRSLPPLPLFPQELSRVVLNLTQNACYAANDRKKSAGPDFIPRVVVRTRRSGREVEVRFRDNGKGLSPAVRERLFTPFFTTKPVGAGTGLGLSISYDIVVRLHQGRLSAESVEGEYAEFVVALPADA
jgi:two-component system, NtrC family, sensor kinase